MVAPVQIGQQYPYLDRILAHVKDTQVGDEVLVILGLWHHNQYFAPFSARQQAMHSQHIVVTVLG